MLQFALHYGLFIEKGAYFGFLALLKVHLCQWRVEAHLHVVLAFASPGPTALLRQQNGLTHVGTEIGQIKLEDHATADHTCPGLTSIQRKIPHHLAIRLLAYRCRQIQTQWFALSDQRV